MDKFQPLLVRNYWMVARMLVVQSKYGMSSIQLFIEQAPNHYHLSNEMSYLTRLSTGDTDIDDENERDEEDDRYDAIDTDEIHLPNDDENCCQRKNIDSFTLKLVIGLIILRLSLRLKTHHQLPSHMAPNLISLMTT